MVLLIGVILVIEEREDSFDSDRNFDEYDGRGRIRREDKRDYMRDKERKEEDRERRHNKRKDKGSERDDKDYKGDHRGYYNGDSHRGYRNDEREHMRDDREHRRNEREDEMDYRRDDRDFRRDEREYYQDYPSARNTHPHHQPYQIYNPPISPVYTTPIYQMPPNMYVNPGFSPGGIKTPHFLSTDEREHVRSSEKKIDQHKLVFDVGTSPEEIREEGYPEPASTKNPVEERKEEPQTDIQDPPHSQNQEIEIQKSSQERVNQNTSQERKDEKISQERESQRLSPEREDLRESHQSFAASPSDNAETQNKSSVVVLDPITRAW